jgi:hypothetical protein
MPGRRLLLTTTAVCVFLIAPAVTSAANRYAEPNGDGAEPCVQSDPLMEVAGPGIDKGGRCGDVGPGPRIGDVAHEKEAPGLSFA